MAGSNPNIAMKLLLKVFVLICLFTGAAPSVRAQAAVPPSFVTVTKQIETPAMLHARRHNTAASPRNRLATLVFEVTREFQPVNRQQLTILAEAFLVARQA